MMNDDVKELLKSGWAGIKEDDSSISFVDRRFNPTCKSVYLWEDECMVVPVAPANDIRSIECIESLLGRKTTRQERLWWYVTRKDKDNYYVVHENHVYSVDIHTKIL